VSLHTAVGPDVERFAGKTVLITGSSGFLGHHFMGAFRRLNSWLDPKVRVIGVDNFICSSRRGFDTSYRASASDDDLVEMWADVSQPLGALREPVHFIVSAAGIASPVHYREHPLETIDVAVKGTRNMLDLAVQNKDHLEGMLYFSSSEIYGDPSVVPTPETYNGDVSCTGPRACYDESKRLGETLCSIYHSKYGVPVKTVRPFNIFGPGMTPRDKRVIPMFTYEALNGRPIPIFRDGLQTRTFCYIEDALVGFIKVLLEGKPGEAYNIGSFDNEISMRALGELFQRIIPGTELNFVPYPDSYPSSEPLRRCPDMTKASEELNYTPRWLLDAGVTEFVEWAKTHPLYSR
jgi:UDP-glucuronate decarboxylase